jgi:hypothetical protein
MKYESDAHAPYYLPYQRTNRSVGHAGAPLRITKVNKQVHPLSQQTRWHGHSSACHTMAILEIVVHVHGPLMALPRDQNHVCAKHAARQRSQPSPFTSIKHATTSISRTSRHQEESIPPRLRRPHRAPWIRGENHDLQWCWIIV